MLYKKKVFKYLEIDGEDDILFQKKLNILKEINIMKKNIIINKNNRISMLFNVCI